MSAQAGNSRTIVRLHAPLHSAVLICVPASHNAMHSGNVMPRPWAVMDAASPWVIDALGELWLGAGVPRCKMSTSNDVATIAIAQGRYRMGRTVLAVPPSDEW